MIQTIKSGVDLTCTVINYSLYVSYNIGQFLVNLISFLQKFVSKLTYLLFEVFVAVFESFSTFYQDVVQNIQNILRTISSVDIITYLSDIRNIIHSLVFIVVTLSEFVVKIILSTLSAIQAILLSPKYVVLYLTKTLWSIVSGIKEAFNDLGIVFSGSIKILLQKMKHFIIEGTLFWIHLPRVVYDFVSEIPVESLLGITISFCIIYLFARFYLILFSFLYRHIKRFFIILRRRYIDLGRYFTRSTASRRVVYRRQILPMRRPHIRTERNLTNSSKSEENDRYCVICQEHIKCVLLLPCRHLCMCNECINTLQMYHNTCPICRSNIETTMQIFV